MAGVRHDTLVLALKDNPALLAELLRRVRGARVPGVLTPADSAVRFTASLETRPDLLFTVHAPGFPWVLVEVQNRPDETKARSWHLAASVLLQRHGMGDLVVITASRAVARWAAAVVRHRGELGTVMGIRPVVIHLSRKQIAALLDPAAPQLAPIAVWAGCRGHGPEAERVAWRALEVTAALPPRLREAQMRAIFAMLDKHLVDEVKENAMDGNKIPLSKEREELVQWFMKHGERVFRMRALLAVQAEGLAEGKAKGLAEGKAKGLAEGKVEGQRSALLALLSARGLTPSPRERERIEGLEDTRTLLECVQCAATAATVAEALAPLRSTTPPRRARATSR